MEKQNQKELELNREELTFLINLVQAHRGSQNMLIGFRKMTQDERNENRKYDEILKKLIGMYKENV